ncbi:hypothetical protein [Methylobacterium brachiatum]|uniref:hypothetical protein n=1 Tax=Methylobacterium brachiatum TaxID=269660 RepID=UPI000B8A1279|nr:hypothetical protein [Methylobacterium brachiatum]
MTAILHDTAADYDREYQRIRATFVSAGTSLNAWLMAQGIDRRLAYRALRGQSLGRRAIDLRIRILRVASEIENAA